MEETLQRALVDVAATLLVERDHCHAVHEVEKQLLRGVVLPTHLARAVDHATQTVQQLVHREVLAEGTAEEGAAFVHDRPE